MTVNSLVLLAVVLLVVSGDDDLSPVTAKAVRPDTRLNITNSPDQSILEIHSDFGIDRATVRRTGTRWPTILKLRLHLRGMESLRVKCGEVTIEWSVPSGQPPRSRMTMWTGQREQPLDPTSPYWSEVTRREPGGTPPNGYYEVVMPKKLYASEPRAIEIQWIDFYRQ